MTELEAIAKRLNDALAAVLDGERQSARHTFESLATASGISKRQLIRLLSERSRDIDVTVLSVLAQVFKTNPAHLLAAAQERMERNPDGLSSLVREGFAEVKPAPEKPRPKIVKGTVTSRRKAR